MNWLLDPLRMLVIAITLTWLLGKFSRRGYETNGDWLSTLILLWLSLGCLLALIRR